jgi:hypothetical protein
MRNLIVRGGLMIAALLMATALMAVDAMTAQVDAVTLGLRSSPDTIVSADRRRPAVSRRRIRYRSSPSARRFRSSRSARRFRAQLVPAWPAPADVWAKLRHCESGGRYDVNTGNGFYGAYQFAAGTWRNLGFPGLPHEASPEMQDEAARRLQARSGWGQWPACSRRLGMR